MQYIQSNMALYDRSSVTQSGAMVLEPPSWPAEDRGHQEAALLLCCHRGLRFTRGCLQPVQWTVLPSACGTACDTSQASYLKGDALHCRWEKTQWHNINNGGDKARRVLSDAARTAQILSLRENTFCYEYGVELQENCARGASTTILERYV